MPGRIILKFTVMVIDALVAGCFVFGIAWGLVQAAGYFDRKPMTPRADGTVVLIPYRADMEDRASDDRTLEFHPQQKEAQRSNFAYHYGRELFDERQRRMLTLRSPDATACWTFQVEEPGRYEVIAAMAESSADGAIAAVVGDQELRGEVQPMVDQASIRNVLMGAITLVDGHPYVIRFSAPKSSSTSPMTLRKIEIRPTMATKD